VYVNLCGGSDELIYDGQSFVVDGEGDIIAQLAGFEEEVRVLDLDNDAPDRRLLETGSVEPADREPEGEIYQALALGVRDFVRKNRLERAFLGLSGGVDSAVVAAIAADAMGPDRVTGVAIPSRYTDPRSTTCAQELARSLGIGFEVVALERLHTAAEETLDHLLDESTTAENVQARLRAMILMCFVNRYGGLLLNTSNKTESALGYGTLYGDMAGTLCPIADLTKPQVYALAHWIQASRGVIPQYTLDRPPSAELRPDQVDPFDYDEVAPAMERLVRENRSDLALRRSEHKRWQMGVVLKVSQKAFGSGRMIPITRR
jgi:NAD+ synthase (glutamine-hydrolysing)